MLTDPNVFDEKSIQLLSKKFKAAYNAQLTCAELLFSELSGEKGITYSLPMQFGSNADFIISIALLLRNKNERIALLQSEPNKS